MKTSLLLNRGCNKKNVFRTFKINVDGKCYNAIIRYFKTADMIRLSQ